VTVPIAAVIRESAVTIPRASAGSVMTRRTETLEALLQARVVPSSAAMTRENAEVFMY
jgi:hypothetical protein